ncbi:insulinase family protein [Verrucomicrobiales bacterium]|nr:insulinase family protein [bacterium]MDB4617314.1 insulinase family protein [Verrucomicrobiales bacterium]MDC0258965.1 insulinase family protein [Verrucomicrobiales bacterium]
MKQTCLAVCAALLAAFAIPALSQVKKSAPNPIPLPQENSDIAADKNVTWGVLENGMRYAILPNVEPPNRVSLRLFVDAGSLMEEDNQQGLAHFLEHMAFNGTTNFPPGEMVEYFQRLGMGFGNHTNAHTSFNETVYKLELPNVEDPILDEAFKLLRDYSDGMQMLTEEIEAERGIIMSEKRTRDSVGWRTFVEQIGFALPEHKVGSRLPIGTEEVIMGAPRERFVEFYKKWYTPNRMALIIVGDIKVDKIEGFIQKYFKDLPGREKAAEPDLGKLAKRGFGTHYHYEKEAGEASVSIETTKPRINPPDNSERRAYDLRMMLAGQMLNRRLEMIAKKEDSPINTIRTHVGDFYDLNFAEYGSIDATCKPENWEAAIAVVEQELRRGLEFGFTDAELKEVKANIQNAYERQAESSKTRKSQDLANQIGSRMGSRRIFTNPIADLPRVTKALGSVTAEECRDHLRGLWDGSNEILVYVSGNVEVKDADKAITQVFNASKAVAVQPPVEKEAAKFAYAEMPAAGEIAEQKEIEDIGVTQLRFKNNVRVNLKITDYEDEKIYVKARVGGGLLTLPKGMAGLPLLTNGTFNSAGLDAHSEDELKQIFAGESVGVGFGVDEDAFAFSGQTDSEDLKLQLLLMRSYLTNPGFKEEAAIEFRRQLDGLYNQLENTPGGKMANEVDKLIHGGDDRFGYPERTDLDSRTMDDAKAWLKPEFENGYLEVSIVGDFDKEATIKALSETFGSLPERASEKPAYTEERVVNFPTDLTDEKYEVETTVDKGSAVVYWPTTDIFDIEKTRRIGMLGAILGDRLRKVIREEKAIGYSPFSHNLPSDVWKDYGYLFANVTIDPPKAKEVGDTIRQISADLATGTSITADELDRAKKPQVVSIEEMRRTNRYWLSSVLESSQEYPERLEWSRTFVDDYKNITLEEVNALAKEIFSNHKGLVIIANPKAKAE